MSEYNAKHGLIAGIAAVAIALLLYLIGPSYYLKYATIISYVIIIVFMIRSGNEVKKSNGGILSFGDAFKHSWVTHLIFSLIFTIFTYVLFNFIDPSLEELVKEEAIKMIEKMSGFMGEEGTSKAIEAIEENGASQTIGNTAAGFLTSLLFPGALLALVIGLIIKREEGNPWDNKKTKSDASDIMP
jgi:uncharacterized membrane protein